MSDTPADTAAMNMGAAEPTADAARASSASGAAGAWHPLQDQRFDPRRKSPALAAVISVFPGLGQIYIGYYVRGFVISAIFWLTFLTAASSHEPVGPILAMGAMFLWAFNIIDAGRMAALYNHVAAGVEAIQMPEDFKLPKMGGSIVGGVILLVFGGIALSNTAFGYSLDWLEDWWPVFPIALGLYLFGRGMVDYMAEQQSTSSRASFDDEAGGDVA